MGDPLYVFGKALELLKKILFASVVFVVSILILSFSRLFIEYLYYRYKGIPLYAKLEKDQKIERLEKALAQSQEELEASREAFRRSTQLRIK